MRCLHELLFQQHGNRHNSSLNSKGFSYYASEFLSLRPDSDAIALVMSFIVNLDRSGWVFIEFTWERDFLFFFFFLITTKKMCNIGQILLDVEGLKRQVITCSSCLKKQLKVFISFSFLFFNKYFIYFS